MPSVQLPVGAIDIANPRDVVRATKSPQKSGTSSSAGVNTPSSSTASGQEPCAEKKKQKKKKQSLGTLLGRRPIVDDTAAHDGSRSHAATHATSQPGKPSFPSSSSGSSLSSSTSGSSSSGDSDVVEAAVASRLKKKKRSKRHSKRGKGRKVKDGKEGKSNDKKASSGHVPIQIQDSRCDLERLVDEIIDDVPALKVIAGFKTGSVPDYVDRIGVTREEAFAKFPDQKPNLPQVPGSTRLSILDLQQPTGQDEVPEAGRASTLTSALELECRRADLLEYQVKMLRGELVCALKRASVLSIIYKLNVLAKVGDAQLREVAQQTCVRKALEEIDALGTGKLIKVLSGKEKKRRSRGSRRKHKASTKSDITESSSTSSGSSIACSSTSSGEE